MDRFVELFEGNWNSIKKYEKKEALAIISNDVWFNVYTIWMNQRSWHLTTEIRVALNGWYGNSYGAEFDWRQSLLKSRAPKRQFCIIRISFELKLIFGLLKFNVGFWICIISGTDTPFDCDDDRRKTNQTKNIWMWRRCCIVHTLYSSAQLGLVVKFSAESEKKVSEMEIPVFTVAVRFSMRWKQGDVVQLLDLLIFRNAPLFIGMV